MSDSAWFSSLTGGRRRPGRAPRPRRHLRRADKRRTRRARLGPQRGHSLSNGTARRDPVPAGLGLKIRVSNCDSPGRRPGLGPGRRQDDRIALRLSVRTLTVTTSTETSDSDYLTTSHVTVTSLRLAQELVTRTNGTRAASAPGRAGPGAGPLPITSTVCRVRVTRPRRRAGLNQDTG